MKAKLMRFVIWSPRGPIWWTRGRVRRSIRGQATIEFALALPVMLLIALGAVDVGRVFHDYIGIRTAAMEGAMYGARHPADKSGAEQRVRDHFPNTVPAGLVPTAASVGDCTSIDEAGDEAGFFTVTVTRDFSPLSLAALQYLAPDTDWVFTVQATAKTRCMT